MAQGSGTITALNGTVAAACSDRSVSAFVVTGTWVATITIEATLDDSNWFTVSGINPSDSSTVTTFSANSQLGVHCGGFSQVRLRASAFTSGTINVNWNIGTSSNFITLTSWMGSTAATVGQKAMTSSLPVVISSDQTHFPIEVQDGSGTNITSTAFNGKQGLDISSIDSVRRLSLAGTHFTTVVEQNLATTAETGFFYLKNPTGSGKNLYINMIGLDTTTKGGLITTRVYKNPTTSANGTAATISNMDIQSSPAATVATAFSLPTVSANGTKLLFASVGANANTEFIDLKMGIVIEPNNTLLITGVGDANNRVAVVSIDWFEV